MHLQGAGGLRQKRVSLPLSELCSHAVLQADRSLLQLKAKLMSSEQLWDVAGMWVAEHAR